MFYSTLDSLKIFKSCVPISPKTLAKTHFTLISPSLFKLIIFNTFTLK